MPITSGCSLKKQDRTEKHWENFPQAFTHLALISTWIAHSVDESDSFTPEVTHGCSIRLRCHHYRQWRGWRNPRIRTRADGQTDSVAGTRRLRPARERKLGNAGGQCRWTVSDQGGLARQGRETTSSSYELITLVVTPSF